MDIVVMRNRQKMTDSVEDETVISFPEVQLPPQITMAKINRPINFLLFILLLYND